MSTVVAMLVNCLKVSLQSMISNIKMQDLICSFSRFGSSGLLILVVCNQLLAVQEARQLALSLLVLCSGRGLLGLCQF